MTSDTFLKTNLEKSFNLKIHIKWFSLQTWKISSTLTNKFHMKGPSSILTTNQPQPGRCPSVQRNAAHGESDGTWNMESCSTPPRWSQRQKLTSHSTAPGRTRVAPWCSLGFREQLCVFKTWRKWVVQVPWYPYFSPLCRLLVKVWGCVPKVCWNNLRHTHYIYELRTKLFVWGKCHHQMGFWMFRTSTSKQKHAIYSVGWFDLLHDRELQESKPRCASSFWQQMQIIIRYLNAPSFILVTLPIGALMKALTLRVNLWNSNEKEDSTFFGPQQGQQTMNLELWSKPFVPQSGM